MCSVLTSFRIFLRLQHFCAQALSLLDFVIGSGDRKQIPEGVFRFAEFARLTQVYNLRHTPPTLLMSRLILSGSKMANTTCVWGENVTAPVWERWHRGSKNQTM